MGESEQSRMSNAIGLWLKSLDSEPGWNDWRRTRIAYTLTWDYPYSPKPEPSKQKFVFSEELERQHSLVERYLSLQQAVILLKDCEYYFRRYPFKGLPVSRHDHILNICEMYFNRFYEFRERMKKFFAALKLASPNHGLDIGGFIKLYDKIFDQELRSRNGVHHDSRFEYVGMERLFLFTMASHKDDGWKRDHIVEYRKLANVWAKRVRKRSITLETFLEAIAKATLTSCSFLEPEKDEAAD